MTLGTTIAKLRKEKGMTQEALAQRLEVSNQAVSKWEADQCCPDIQLLPKLADIFGVTMDTLFGRETAPALESCSLPWEEDGVLRVVLFMGQTLIGGHEAAERIEFSYDGKALNIESAFSVSCNEVQGNVTAGGNVNCDSILGHVTAGGNITCDGIHGNVTAEGSVTCDDVSGSVNAGGNITCDSVDGDASAGGNLTADTIEGNARAGGNIRCDEINGAAVQAGGSIYCDHREE